MGSKTKRLVGNEYLYMKHNYDINKKGDFITTGNFDICPCIKSL